MLGEVGAARRLADYERKAISGRNGLIRRLDYLTFEARRRDFEKKVQEAQRKVQERSRALEQSFNNARNEIGQVVLKVINDIAVQRSITVVLDRAQVQFASDQNDITGDTIKMLDQRLADVFEVMPRSLPTALVMIDLDHFKPINDTAGHAAGDAMLKAVAAAITSRVRATDLVARIGGDEFALLLERCKPEVAIADAVIALVSNIALANPATQARTEFKPEWFDIASDETPEGVKPDTSRDRYKA